MWTINVRILSNDSAFRFIKKKKKRSPFLEAGANFLNKFSRMARNMITLLEEGSNCSIGNVFFF